MTIVCCDYPTYDKHFFIIIDEYWLESLLFFRRISFLNIVWSRYLTVPL